MFLKEKLIKLKKIFCETQAPIGLSAMGLKRNYLEKINCFNYSTIRFYSELISPVQEPFYFSV